jgi:hypothetical protein
MGRYVLLEFDSDDTANALCAKITAAHDAGKGMKVLGIFQRPPTKRCECQNRVTEGRNNETARHWNLGFYYCKRCKRVTRGWQAPRNLMGTAKVPYGRPASAWLHLDSNGRPIENYPINDGK